MRDKVTRLCPQTSTFEEKREPKQIRTEVLLLMRLSNSFTARPNRLAAIISVDGFCLVCGRESSPAIAYTNCGRDMIYLPLVAGAAGRQADRQADRAAVGLLQAGQHTDYQPVGQRTTPPLPPPPPILPVANRPYGFCGR